MKKNRRPGRLPRWQEWSVYLTFGLLIATGIAWLLLDSFVRVGGEFGPEHHPSERWALVAHGVVAYGFLIVAGAMIPVHIVKGWSRRRNLMSGLILAGTLLLLGTTALGLYYVGEDLLRNFVSNVHWVVGLVALPALVIHALIGRSSR